MNLQQDYGGFDPVFPGITIELVSESARKFFNASTREDFSAGAWKTGTDPEVWFEALSVQSALAHECRHFHDSLIAPYAARVFGLRFRQITHLYQALPSLIQPDVNCLPLPVPIWCMLDELAREQVLKRLGRHPAGQPWRPSKLPYLPDLPPERPPKVADIEDQNTLAWLLREGWRDQQRILNMAQRASGADSRLPHAWQIMELSALVVQLQDILNVSGLEAGQFFEARVLALKNDPYAHILRMACLPWTIRGKPCDLRVVAGMAFWSMLGSFELDQWNATPEYRFEQLLVHLRLRGPCDLPNDWLTLWEQWSNELKLSTVQAALDDTRRYWQRVVEIADEATKHGNRLESEAQLLAKAARGYKNASEFMIRKFLASPNGYTDPPSYLANMIQWVDPMLRLTFPKEKALFKKSDPELNRKGVFVHWAYEEDDHLLVVSMLHPFRFSGKIIMGESEALKLFSDFALVDGIFSRHAFSRNEDARLAVKTFFQDSGLTPFVILQSPPKNVVEASNRFLF